MNGLKLISSTFASLRAQGRTALMPYFTLGYPTPETSLDILEAAAHAGADLLELGIPFSDPLADGPTIQHSTQIALENGITVAGCLEMTATLRQRGLQQPLLLMGYFNPVMAYGIERFAADAARSGADGLILPDLPPEEAGDVEAACQLHGLALIFLVSPNTPDDRLAYVAGHTSGFLYLVSLTGVTGARRSLSTGLQQFVRRARAVTDKPLAVGFGISTPDQAQHVATLADGVIVGSALVDVARKNNPPAPAAGLFVADIRKALDGG